MKQKACFLGGGAVLALAFGGLLLASPAGAQSLEEALAAAYTNNPELLAQRAEQRAVDEGVPQALANWRPKVTLSGDLARTHTHLNTRTTTNRDQMRSPRSADLVVTQPLFRGLRTAAGVAEAENDVLSQRAKVIAKEQDVLLAAATAYMGVVRDQAVLQLNINNEQVLRRQLEATRDRFRVGEITRTDVSQAEARLAGATADRIAAEGNLDTSRAEYQNVVGEAPRNLIQPAAPTDLPDNLEAALAAARTRHPDVVSAEFNVRSANDNIKSVRGELLPSLEVVGTLSRAWESSTNDSQVTTGSVKLDLTVPIYQKGSVYSRLREAKIDAGKSRLTLDDARRDQIQAAADAWETLQAAKARIQSFNAQIKASEIALEGVQREATVGSRTVLDVLDAEQELLDAKVNLVRAQRDEVVAAFELKETAGILTSRDMKLPVQHYDPADYYNQIRMKLFGGDLPGGAE
ncbi:MAG: TolC family outer membrane protein [Rhodospirillales bacterium]|jgi:outer membrane protein|nr:TolC family outer membrane protein [Rhodospirillales bacterium]MDP6643034.1 TolC family outer membrane protein [Rhodospirillales bacterium]MDP6842654.1 TolC family outer membrane protein [Rhodospirillales bacterium]